ncbi:MAG: InlB B-repeat-containing protein [Candidatus Competibacteraceae bacterium]
MVILGLPIAQATNFTVNNLNDSSAGCGSHWEATLRFDGLNSVAYGRNIYVAVGYDGTILTSSDATSWTRRITGTLEPLYGVAWSGAQFVAVGWGGTILTSPDGVTWTPRYLGTTGWLFGVAWSGAQFVAVGSGVMTSPDGVTWTSRVSGTLEPLYGVAWSGTQFVAVGGDVVVTSPDGVTWTSRASGTTGGSLRDVAWSGTQFVAVGWGGVIVTSPDGITWTSRTSKYASNDVAWSGTQFVAVGFGDAILTSPDGVTWTSRASGTTGGSLRDVAWSGTQFVAVGFGGVIVTSPDGVTWTSRVSGYQLLDVTWSGTQFVAVGTDVMTSPDGVTWTSRVSGYSLSGVTWSGTQFVAVGTGVMTSPDGVTWTSRVSGYSLNGVTWSGTQFVAVGWGGTILTSPDGVTWTPRYSGTTGWLHGVAWSGTQFVAVGDDGAIVTSPDGVMWTSRTSGTQGRLNGVAWSGTQFVAVGGNNTSTSSTILTSPDGVTWTSRASGTQGWLNGVAWSGTQFVAVGFDYSNAILTSADGVTWTSHSSGTTNMLFGVAWGGTQFVAVGDIILRSDCAAVTHHPLTVNKTGGNGTVISDPAGVNCGAVCTFDFNSDTRVTLTARPDAGYSFNAWSGDCAGTSCSLTMDAEKNVTAMFNAPVRYLLTVGKSGTGAGTVTSDPAGISCGSTCTAPFISGQGITLTAVPAAGSLFVKWSGCVVNPANPRQCTLTITSNRTVIAQFIRPPVLTVSKTGNGAGLVVGPGINCGVDCTETYPNPITAVVLTATPALGSDFIGWTGCTPLVANPRQCAVTMNQARIVYARFTTTTPGKNALTVYKASPGLGTVVSAPAGINCGSTCLGQSANFTSGSAILLTATPTIGSTFVGWSTNCTPLAANPRQCMVIMNTARIVTVRFNRPVLTVTKIGSGLVTSAPSGIACGLVCAAPFDLNATVILTATRTPGFRFGSWRGCTPLANRQQCTVTMNQSKTATAVFE